MLNFIVNTLSGKGRGQQNLHKIIDYCYRNRIDYTLHITGAQGHAVDIARQLSAQDCGVIVAVGGDGTFHEVLSGVIDPSKTPIGFVPSGRGNDFAEGAKIPFSVDKALDLITKGKEVFYDYIQIGDKRCLNVAGTGLDIDVLQRVDGKNGKINYLKSLIYCLKHFEPYHIEVTDEDGKQSEYEVIMIGIGNGSQFGGGIKVCPNSKVDDGLLDISIVTMPEDKRLLPILPHFVKGHHEKLKVINAYRCKKICVKTNRPIQLDGEIYEGEDLDCVIVEKGLRTFDPRSI